MTTANLAAEADTTIDAFLGGRVEAVQPARGHHRAGLEAVLLAAALDADMSGTIIDLGAGAGVAGFCAAWRCPDARVILVERDQTSVACARAALERSANSPFAGRVTVVETDIAKRAGLSEGTAEAVICNPPFHLRAAGSISPSSGRATAHVLDEGGLETWFRAAAALLRPRGVFIVIFRASGLDALLSVAKGRFGALDILPIAPRGGEPAHRVIIRGIKNSRAPLRLLPPLVLHASTGNSFRPEIDPILREGAGLASVVAPWRRE